MNSITLAMPINHTVTVICDGKNITNVVFDMKICDEPDSLCRLAADQISEYVAGKRKCFSLPYDISSLGTPFFRSILPAVTTIPYGERITYAKAAELAKSGAVRACGSALKRNPLPIIIPCHRIVPASGGTGNYMGGQGNDIKAFLLELEEKYK